MRLGIDCTAIDPNYKGGVNTFTFGLLKGLLGIHSVGVEYIIFCSSTNEHLFTDYLANDKCKIVVVKKHAFFKKIFLILPFLFNSLKLWELSMNLFSRIFKIKNTIEESCDLLYVPTTVLNVYNLSIPTFLSMHDIQQYHYPEFFTKNELKHRRLTFENSAKNASYFQASSHFIKDDILHHFNWLREDQVVVISEGVDIDKFSNICDRSVIKKFQLPEQFLFFPAQLWKHKNHITVLKALRKIEIQSGISIPLVMTGAKYSGSNDVLDFVKNNDINYVYYLGKVEFPELLALYKEARYLVSAALYESSSLPILEAAAAGLPIIASKTPPNIEMSKDIEMNFFEPLGVTQCAETIKCCWLGDENSMKDQAVNNSKAVRSYSWNAIAEQYQQFMIDKLEC